VGSGEQRSLHFFYSSRGATNPVIMALLSAFQALAGKMVRINVMTPYKCSQHIESHLTRQRA
jgi:hypothetical protein